MIEDYLYGAYGSNLNQRQMETRCPDAVPMGNIALDGFKLVFRSVADITESDGSEVALGLWKISRKDLAALDHYEGYPMLYTKIWQKTPHGLVMLYQLRAREYVSPPSSGYLTTISDGYEDFGLDRSYLKDAVMESYEYMTA